MNDFIDEFADEIIRIGLCSRNTMHGCQDFEIQELETLFQVKLPTIYKAFLKKMGKGAGKLLLGTDYVYGTLFTNREGLEELLQSDGQPFTLSKNYFVFLSHQGYVYGLFDTAENSADPSVYGYTEGELKFTKLHEKFSDFLLDLI